MMDWSHLAAEIFADAHAERICEYVAESKN